MTRIIASMTLLTACVAVGCGGGSDAKSPNVVASAGSGGTGATSGGTAGASNGSGGTQTVVMNGVTVTPATARVAVSTTLQFSASVTGASSQAVSWSVQEGASAGSITADGLYTAPASEGTFHIVATSTADGKLTGSANVGVIKPGAQNPALKSGVWVHIDPPGLNYDSGGFPGPPFNGKTFGAAYVEIDPNAPLTLYLCVDQLGLWKTTDGGQTWARLGDPTKIGMPGDTTVGYLDSPIMVRVDPMNSQHLYATEGVRGQNFGFWDSTDGGTTWKMPAGFAAQKMFPADVTTIDTDPLNFGEILLSYHWNMSGAGFLSSLDNEASWQVFDTAGTATKGVHFLHQPNYNIGDDKTWLIAGESGIFRTADAGKSWNQVATGDSAPHGGNFKYYSSDHKLYMGAKHHPIRSDDNGVTWTALSNGTQDADYYSVMGDGKNLFTCPANGTSALPCYTSPESDGLTWTPYQGANAQTFSEPSVMLVYDGINHILYGARFDEYGHAADAGLWALKDP